VINKKDKSDEKQEYDKNSKHYMKTLW